jgi:hypothetical protein
VKLAGTSNPRKLVLRYYPNDKSNILDLFTTGVKKCSNTKKLVGYISSVLGDLAFRSLSHANERFTNVDIWWLLR